MTMMAEDPIDLGDKATITTRTLHPTKGPFAITRDFPPALIGACMHSTDEICCCAMINNTKRMIKIHVSAACGETDKQAMQRVLRIHMCVVRGKKRQFPTQVMRYELMQTKEYQDCNVMEVPLNSVTMARFHDFEILDRHSTLRLQVQMSEKKPCQCLKLLKQAIRADVPDVLLEIVLSYMEEHTLNVSIGMSLK